MIQESIPKESFNRISSTGFLPQDLQAALMNLQWIKSENLSGISRESLRIILEGSQPKRNLDLSNIKIFGQKLLKSILGECSHHLERIFRESRNKSSGILKGEKFEGSPENPNHLWRHETWQPQERIIKWIKKMPPKDFSREPTEYHQKNLQETSQASENLGKKFSERIYKDWPIKIHKEPTLLSPPLPSTISAPPSQHPRPRTPVPINICSESFREPANIREKNFDGS